MALLGYFGLRNRPIRKLQCASVSAAVQPGNFRESAQQVFANSDASSIPSFNTFDHGYSAI